MLSYRFVSIPLVVSLSFTSDSNFTRLCIFIDVVRRIFYIFQGSGGVSQQGASAHDDLDGPQDEGGSDSLGPTARRTRSKIVRLFAPFSLLVPPLLIARMMLGEHKLLTC